MTTGQRGFDRVRQYPIGKMKFSLNYFEEVGLMLGRTCMHVGLFLVCVWWGLGASPRCTVQGMHSLVRCRAAAQGAHTYFIAGPAVGCSPLSPWRARWA